MRRDEYLKALCRELHGLPKDFNKSVKATQIRMASMAAKKARKEAVKLDGDATGARMAEIGKYRTGGALARFDRDYWEKYWTDNPHEVPDKGSNLEECFRNFQQYVSRPSITLLYLKKVLSLS